MSGARLARNAVSSAGQIIVSAGLLFELYRFVTQYLSVAEIGIWSIVLASSAIGRVADLGLANGIVRFVALDAGLGDRLRAASTIGMATIMIAVVVAALCVLLFPVLSTALGYAITDPSYLLEGQTLLPYGLASLWITILAALYSGALDGLQRTDLRALITVVAGVSQLIVVYLVVPRMGLTGLAISQLIQGGIVLIASLIAVAVLLGQRTSAWVKFERERARQMLTYGGSLQIAAIGQMLFDPTVKLLLSFFGGLSMTGYYELANRMITQFRAVIVSAFQMLVPYVAGTNPDHSGAARIYARSYGMLAFLAIPYYALIALALSPLLQFWTGDANADFLTVAYFTLAGWAANTMVGPAYFLYLALGRVRWPVVTQLIIGLLNLVLGLAGGVLAGGLGVLAASSISLGVGSLLILGAFQLEFRVPFSEIIPTGCGWLATFSGLSATVSVVFGYRLARGEMDLLEYVAWGSLSAGGITLLGWRNSNRSELFHLLKRVIPG